MVKRLHKILIFAFLTFFSLEAVAASAMLPGSNEMEQSKVSVIQLQVKGNVIRVLQAQGHFLEVYSVTGAKVACVKIDSADQSVRLNLTKGCYIIKVGDVARKISIL